MPDRRKCQVDVCGLHFVLREDADELACHKFLRDKKLLDGASCTAAEKRALKHLSVISPYDGRDRDLDRSALAHKL